MPGICCSIASIANDRPCVKTHTFAKCRKHNSPTRHRTSRVQYVLTLRDAIDQRDFYVWRERWSFRTTKTQSGRRPTRNPAVQQSSASVSCAIVSEAVGQEPISIQDDSSRLLISQDFSPRSVPNRQLQGALRTKCFFRTSVPTSMLALADDAALARLVTKSAATSEPAATRSNSACMTAIMRRTPAVIFNRCGHASSFVHSSRSRSTGCH